MLHFYLSKPIKLALMLLVVGIPLMFLGRASAAYLQNELIDDPLFLNAYSMSPQQIQSFLQSKGSYLANYTTTETESYYPNYNKTVLAAQVIYDAGQVYGINPQVILATLQKEESLVTDPSPAASQINFAMGYGCSDSGGCGSYSGFFNQVDNGTWQLRFNFERARGNNSWWNPSTPYPCANSTQYYSPGLFPGNNVTFYDDYGTAYDTFVITNASTAALYCYTPHAYPGSAAEYYSGSYNFVIDYNQWFGSPLVSFALIKPSNSTGIYLLDGPSETVYFIPSPSVMSALNLSSTPVDIIDPSAFSDFTSGGTLSTLIRQSNGTIYLAESGSRFAIGGAAQCTAWGLDCFDSSAVQTLSDGFIDNLANGGNLPALQENGGTVYLMQNGDKDPVLSPQELSDLGYGWNDVVHMSAINSTQPLGPLLLPNGTAVKYRSSNGIYLYDDNAYHLITDPDLITAWGLGNGLAANPPTSSYDTTAPSLGDPLSSIYASDGTNTYLIDQGSKKDITANINDWPVSNTITFAPTALSKLPTTTATDVVRSQSGGIYVMANATKELIPTTNIFSALGYTASDLTSISDYTASQLPDGPIKLSDGTLFRVNDGAAIYYVNNNQSLLIPNPSYFGYFNLDASKIINFTGSVLTAYPQGANLSVLVENQTGQYYIASDGRLYALTSQMINDWGISTSGATVLTNQNFIALPSNAMMTDFARTPNGAIYYGQGGSEHPISSYSEFLSLGGNSSNTINVSADFIALCPVGSTEE